MTTLVDVDADRQLIHTRVPFGGPQLVVLDTNTIFNDLLYQLRHGREVGVLIRSAQEDAVRLFATVDVYREVKERAATQERRGYSGNELLDRFARQYLPYIRVVDVTGMPIWRRALPVGERDPDDLPTALLALLLAPSQVYTDDADLTDAGFGEARRWLQVTQSAERTMQVDRTALIIAALMRWGWQKLRVRAKGEIRELKFAEVALGGAMGLAALAVLPPTGHVALDRVLSGSVRLLAGTGEAVLGTGLGLLSERAHHSGLLAQTVVAPEVPPTLDSQLARELALRGPLQGSKLALALGADISAVESLLRSRACFVHGDHGWWLGQKLASAHHDRGHPE